MERRDLIEAIVPGMIVLGRDGATLGRVKAKREVDFVLDRLFARDVYIPYDVVEMVGNDAITLSTGEHDLESLGWEHPPLAS